MANRWRIFNICFITLLFLLLTLSHYHELLVGIPVIADVSITSFLGLSGHVVERFIYILLVIYAGWSLGIKFGIATWVASALAMLPPALFISTNPIDALIESLAALIISGLSISLIQMHRGWHRQKQKLRGIKVALRTSQENYEELFTNASDAIWVHDMDGKIVIANKACEKVTGYSPDGLIGKSVSELMAPDALIIAKEVKTKLMKGQSIDQRYDQRLIKKDGSETIIELFTRLIKADGKPSDFHNIARDVTEERKLRDNLRIQIHRTLMAQEEERKRIARELHDDVAQSILLLSRRLDILISEGAHKPPKASVSELEDIQAIANEAYKSLQRYARDLRPSILDQMGLVAALNWLADELSKELGIKATVKADKLPPLISSEIELVMFRIAQESLNNVRKHAQASKVKIAVESSSSNMRMIITDNGKGFLTSRLTGNLAREGKLGLLGMEERARLIGGSLQIKSEPGKGTIVIAKAPIQT
ncbi:MAG: PAS domain S-box protein [Chloroflexi bacterium]|jgi:PAS domain S-box-containing protein|nr:PAS domain S-box protein [Chloroflexota bacterium]